MKAVKMLFLPLNPEEQKEIKINFVLPPNSRVNIFLICKPLGRWHNVNFKALTLLGKY